MKNKSERTLYLDAVKKAFLVKIPKMLKFLFKKYEFDRNSFRGSRIANNVVLPIKLHG